MPAHIIDGMVKFISENLTINVWDGEIPRYDTAGNPIYPEATPPGPTEPINYPIFKCYLREPGLDRSWTFEDAYYDQGNLLIQIWSNTRSLSENTMNDVETLLADSLNWPRIQLPGGEAPNNPYYVISCILKGWYSGQEEGVRDPFGQYLYRCDMYYETAIHGAVPTRGP